MASSVYLASSMVQAGKSSIALGLLDHLSRTVGRVGVFRPITRTRVPADDHVLDLMLSRLDTGLTPEQASGVTYEAVHDDPRAAMATILDRYHAVAERFDAVLVLGSDFTGAGSPTEFSYNARIAANLGCPMILVVPGFNRTLEDLRALVDGAIAEISSQHAQVLAIVANGVPPEDLTGVQQALTDMNGHVPGYAIPVEPVLLAPTVRDLVAAAQGTLVHGDDALLDREAIGLVVAAMNIPHVLDALQEGAVAITPADRVDVILALVVAHQSAALPSLAGIILNGGFAVAPQVSALIDGLGTPLPVVLSPDGTLETARTLSRVVGNIGRGSTRKIETAINLFDEYVDGPALLRRLDLTPSTAVTPLMFEHVLVARARQADRHVVLPEGEEDRILVAADQILRRRIARLTLLGNPDAIDAKAKTLRLHLEDAQVLDPRTDVLREQFAHQYSEIRRAKGVTLDQAFDVMSDVSYFGTMMVRDGLADGMVSGAVNTTAHTIRPALQVIRTCPDIDVVSSVFLMCLPDRVLVYGDCAVVPDPSAEELADIAITSAGTAATFGIEPRVAMLSYSTGQSGTGADVEKVRRATALVRERVPDLLVEGPIQYDAAVDPVVARSKVGESPVAGRATVLVFPDLNTGNNTYKAVQRSAGAVAIGPILQGLRKPVNDLSRGALVSDIVNTVAITAIQAAGQ